jgi:hypothetical protein
LLEQRKLLYTRYTHYINKRKKLNILILIKGLSKPISRYTNTRKVIKLNYTIFVLLFSIFKIGINMLCILIIAVLIDYIKR